MKYSTILALTFAVCLGAANVPDMDSVRGEQVFSDAGCIQCHALNGRGGHEGPDLLRVLDRSYTPTELAGTMWNHASTMWSRISDMKVTVGKLSVNDAGDLLALLYASHFFETTGDAARGKQLFTEKSCARCHGLTQPVNPNAKPLSEWRGMEDPVALVDAMWNHSADMWDELKSRKVSWPSLNAQEMTDLLVYIRNASASARSEKAQFHIVSDSRGAALFESRGCGACHDAQNLHVRGLTLTSIAASMWNHATFLHNKPPRFEGDEMRPLLGYYWADQFFASAGNATRGARVFETKHCAECHSAAGPGPMLASQAGTFTPIRLISVIWSHGPAMQAEMRKRNIAWPVFRQGEMADLIAFLNRPAANTR